MPERAAARERPFAGPDAAVRRPPRPDAPADTIRVVRKKTGYGFRIPDRPDPAKALVAGMREILSTLGRLTLAEVERDTRDADRSRLAKGDDGDDDGVSEDRHSPNRFTRGRGFVEDDEPIQCRTEKNGAP